MPLDATEKRGDAVFTPDWCAADMVRFFRPSGAILEPCRGAGAFMRHLPPDTNWCEITEGRDFFAWSQPVDWIITNPPYSKTRPFLKHALRLARNVVFLVPARNIFSGYGTVREAADYGRMKNLRWYGTGGNLGFPMGNAIAAMHWQRGYSGPLYESFYEEENPPNGGARRKALCKQACCDGTAGNLEPSTPNTGKEDERHERSSTRNAG